MRSSITIGRALLLVCMAGGFAGSTRAEPPETSPPQGAASVSTPQPAQPNGADPAKVETGAIEAPATPPREADRPATNNAAPPPSGPAPDAGVPAAKQPDAKPAATADLEPATKETAPATAPGPDAAAAGGGAATAMAVPPPPPPATPVIAIVRDKLKSAKEGSERAALAGFYGEHTGDPFWVIDGGYTSKGDALIAELRRADDWGLKAAAYDAGAKPGTGAPPEALAEAEIRVSLAALTYARHAKGGRVVPRSLSRNLDRDPNWPDPAKVIRDLAPAPAPDAFLRDFHPKHPQFEALRQALLATRGHQEKVEKVEEPPVELPTGSSIKPGAKHAQIALLRRRLKLAGESGQQETYDAALVDAVKAFQRERGLKASGVLNNATRNALNGPKKKPARPDDTALRLIANMERWRWMPDDLGAFHVWDNIPEFMMSVVKNGEEIHREKIIVGKVENATPVFSADMLYVMFHPEWGVPDSIKVKEILPYLRPQGFDFFGFGGADTRVLERHNLRVNYNGRPVNPSQVDWQNVDIRRYTFIQPPGPTNVLGFVKFRFPNKHDVYMHDTPQRHFFAQERRAESHGCIRVQNPQRLAEVLLEQDQGSSPADVERLKDQGADITLETPIPVHVNYFTAVAGKDGKVSYFGDLYGHDSRLIAALEGRRLAEEDFFESASSDEALRTQQTRLKSRNRKKTNDPMTDMITGIFGP